MDKISIELKDGKTSYQPGEKIRGELEWELAQEVPDITINIFWYNGRYRRPGFRSCHNRSNKGAVAE